MENYPSNWLEKPLKYVDSFSTDSLPESTNPEYRFRYVDIGSVSNENGIEQYAEMDFADCPSRARKRVHIGDTIVSTVRTYLKAIALIEDSEDVIVSTGFSVIRPMGHEPGYLHYLCSSELFCNQVNKYAWGVSYPAISEGLMGGIKMPIPPSDEQKTIARFLDMKCATIDATTSILETQISTLERYRASVIHEAVTRGLDPTAPTKPSGVDWIGGVPKNWELNRMRYLASMESGATPSKDNLSFWEGTTPWVSSMEVKQSVLQDTSLHISKEAIESCSTRILPEGTLVMVVRSGILQHTIPVALLGKPMTINQDVKAFTFNDSMVAKYFYYFVKGNNDNLLKTLLKDKSTVDNINQEYLKSLLVPVPPIEEQLQIADYLDARTAAIDAVLDTKRKQLDVLKRRRQSLIYEYVTGKRRVNKEA